MTNRRDKHNYYLDIAMTVAERSTCMRRMYGSIIVKEDEIISTGYCGSPRGASNCCDIGVCLRESMNVPRGQRYEICRSVHAEANCIISAARRDMQGSALYLVGIDSKTKELLHDAENCSMCRRLIINSGIEKVFIRRTMDTFAVHEVQKWIDTDDYINTEALKP